MTGDEISDRWSVQEASISSTMRDVIRGKVIELDDHPGIEDGRDVEVMIRSVPDQDAQWEATLRTAGSMADNPEFDVIMAQIERERRSNSSR